MRLTTVLALAATGAALLPAGAQVRAPEARVFTLENTGIDRHRAALGVATTSTGTLRDTLGIMITAVTKGSPAERAGLEEGNRIAAINGVSLRANAADIEDAEMSGALTRRLARELARAKPGDDVELRVYREGRTTSMKLRTTDSDSLFRRREVTRLSRAELEDRPALGFSVGSTGNRRDTLGVFVSSVLDSTPAARAGIEEGNRIAAINGVSLRVTAEDAGDRYVGGVKVQRLQREISQLKPGSDVTLRVYSSGQFRDVHLKVGRAGDLPRGAGRMMSIGDDAFGDFGSFEGLEALRAQAPLPAMPPMTPMSPTAPRRVRVPPRTPLPPSEEFRIEIGPEVRRQLEVLRSEVNLIGPELESIGPALERLRPEMERIRTEIPRAVRAAREAAMSSRVM